MLVIFPASFHSRRIVDGSGYFSGQLSRASGVGISVEMELWMREGATSHFTNNLMGKGLLSPALSDQGSLATSGGEGAKSRQVIHEMASNTSRAADTGVPALASLPLAAVFASRLIFLQQLLRRCTMERASVTDHSLTIQDIDGGPALNVITLVNRALPAVLERPPFYPVFFNRGPGFVGPGIALNSDQDKRFAIHLLHQTI